MPARLHTAGILQYSDPIRKRIEDWVLKVYAGAFIPLLEKEVGRADQRLESLREQMEQVREIVKELRENPGDMRRFMGLMSFLVPLMLNGVVQQFGIRPDRLEYHLQRGNRRGIDKYLGRVDQMIDTLQEQSEKGLVEQGKQMKADLESWKQYHDPKFSKELEKKVKREKKPPTLEIDLEPDQFPFLGEKFQRHVEKARGEGAGMFDDMPKMQVILADLGQPGMMGAWNPRDHDLVVALPQFAPLSSVKANLDHTLKHELRHMTQTVMAKALGIETIKLEGDDFVPQYRPSPGMGPRAVLDPDIVQALMHDTPSSAELEKAIKDLPREQQEKARRKVKEVETKRKALMKAHGLQSKRSIYNLDDLEFYTHLADRVMQFEDILDALKDKTPAQRKFAFDLFTGGVSVPRQVRKALETMGGLESSKEAQDWVAKYDPDLTILSVARQPDQYFRHLRKYRPEKWQKAVKEFAKEIQPKLGEPETERKGLGELWKEFLDERYEGGKEKVRNPNPDTREGHPDITVNYLMKQDAPVYQPGRLRIRREFAQWRARRQGQMKPEGQLDLFALPPK